MLLTNRAGKRRTSTKTFPQAEAALAWCRSSGALMIYCPGGRPWTGIKWALTAV